jgi:hypothetical protein
MSPRRTRSRLLDLAVTSVCVACVCAPLLPVVNAATRSDGANGSVVESGGSVDQRVVAGGIISNPLNGSFESGGTGTVDGSVQWDMYTTARGGMKLVLSSDRTPAMRDSANGIDVGDMSSAADTWSVGNGDRRFGISVVGGLALSRFDDGRKWRGLEGKRAVEVARRGGPIAQTRTTVKLRAQFAASLPANARPTVNLRATAVPNL